MSARDFAQTKDLLALWNVEHALIGNHGGKGKLRKVVNLFQRAAALSRAVSDRKAEMAVSHGSRSQVLAAWRLGIPSVLMLDYEFTESRIFNTLATHLLMPVHIPDKRLADAGFNLRKVVRYPGFKEEIYLRDFVPQADFRRSFSVNETDILITLRPPSTTGNYHDARSEELFRACVQHLTSDNNTHCLIVNRTSAEARLIPEAMRKRQNISFLRHPVDGLQLMWHSDLVISGGGTMNRESALLGVPTYSIFTGRRAYLDEHLQEMGRLRFIESEGQVRSIPIVKREINGRFSAGNKGLAAQIVDTILSLQSKSKSHYRGQN